jgi:hypothetical protein
LALTSTQTWTPILSPEVEREIIAKEEKKKNGDHAKPAKRKREHPGSTQHHHAEVQISGELHYSSVESVNDPSML